VIFLQDILKEAGRIILLAVIAWLLTDQVINRVVDLVTLNYQLDMNLKLQITGVITTVLKSVDRWLHESKVAEKGITRF